MTVAHSSECSKDDVNIRRRWKLSTRQQDTYTDTTIPYLDSKVAAALCRGGPITYLVKREFGVTDGWLFEHGSLPQKGGHGIWSCRTVEDF